MFICEDFLEIPLEWTINRLPICSPSIEKLQNFLLHYSEYCFSKKILLKCIRPLMVIMKLTYLINGKPTLYNYLQAPTVRWVCPWGIAGVKSSYTSLLSSSLLSSPPLLSIPLSLPPYPFPPISYSTPISSF